MFKFRDQLHDGVQDGLMLLRKRNEEDLRAQIEHTILQNA